MAALECIGLTIISPPGRYSMTRYRYSVSCKPHPPMLRAQALIATGAGTCSLTTHSTRYERQRRPASRSRQVAGVHLTAACCGRLRSNSWMQPTERMASALMQSVHACNWSLSLLRFPYRRQCLGWATNSLCSGAPVARYTGVSHD